MLAIHKDYPGNLVSEVENFLSVNGDQSIPQRLAERIRLTPELIVFQSDSGIIRYAEFNRATNRIARSLINSYRGEKNTVGLLFGHTPAAILGIYGVLKAGLIYVPLDRDYPKANLEYYIRDSQLKTVLTDSANLSLAEALSPEDGVVINIDQLDPTISDGELELSIPPDAIAAIYYTSGSTGQPKGIIKKHNALHHRPYGFGTGDRQAFLSSFAYAASLNGVFGAVLNGVTLCFFAVKESGIGKLADWLNENRITVFVPPISLFHQLVEILKDEDFFPYLRYVQLAGDRVNVALVEEFRKHISNECLIKHFLASSEAGASAAFIITSDTQLSKQSMPAGYPTIDKKVLIIDEDGQPLGPGQLGEIVVKGKYVAGGYWGDAAKDQEKFAAASENPEEKMVFTGDMGLMHSDGLLELHGRKDQLVKVRGYRVEISQVEALLIKIQGIREAAVVTQEINAGNQRLIAYIASDMLLLPRVNDIRQELEKEIPRHMVPTQFIFMEKLPRTPNGKIDRKALPAPTDENIARDIPFQAPRNNVEAQLARVWERITGVKPIGVNDNFFDVGGDSLQAMRIFVEIERMTGKKLPLSLLFKASTVAQQAELLQKKDWVADWSSLIEIQANGSAPPLFCLPGVGGNVLNFHDLSNRLGNDQPCYALQSKGLGMQEEPLTRINEIARYHLKVIKEVQPEGPYYLCGASFGGMVAYEMAQQLHSKGERVALVAMFDTHSPNYHRRRPGMSRDKTILRRKLRHAAKHLANLKGLDLPGRYRYLRLRLPSYFGRLRLWLHNKYQQIRYPLPEDLKKVRKANKQAARYELLKPEFEGRLVLFRATNQPFWLIPDPLLGWGEIAQGRIEVIPVEGHHDTLLWEPQVGNVAKALKQILDELHQQRKENATGQAFGRYESANRFDE
jgi:amino acid adenylation domain-containing protein